MQEGECSHNKSAAIDVDNAGKHGKDVAPDVHDSTLVNFMEREIASTCGKPSYRSTIFTVPEDIRNDDHAAYRPKVVSIGLFHQGRLKGLEGHKWHYLDKVLSRSKNNLNVYVKEMKKTAVEAGSCYSGYPESESGGMALLFEKIMLVDGCFVINLLLQLEDGLVEINDPIYSNRWTLPRVGHDLLLLENQLPFFVLEKLWELTGRERPALKTRVLQFFRNLLPVEHDLELPETEDVHHLLHLIHLSLQPASSSKKPESTGGTTIPNAPQAIDTLSSTKNSSFESPKPLQPASPTEKLPESTSGSTITRPPQPGDTLSSTQNSSFESPESSPAMTSQPVNIPRTVGKAYFMPHDPTPSGPEQIPRDLQIKPESTGGTPIRFNPPQPIKRYKNDELPIPSGLEQIRRGLAEIPRAQQIKQMSEPRPPPPPKTVPSATELQEAGVKFQRKKARSFLDVTFEQGLMQMPCLTISDSTNSLFRNFVAFEQGFPDCGSHFTSYCIFMDSLINTPRDVEILKQSGIIEHVLGSDEEVAFLFNNLSRGITWDFKYSYLAKVFEDVSKHTQKRWPKWRAKLVRDYFSNPWAILSLIAAIVILILTFLQTYFAVFAYFRPP